MKLMNSILDSLQSGLVISLLVLWGVGLALNFIFSVFYRGAVKITGWSWRSRKTYSHSLVASLEPTLFQTERGLPPRLSTT
jgi:hypothetical protein